jgi:N-acetylneuraminic acid mutarotase
MASKHAIIVLKNKNGDYLQYFDERWNSLLFLNCKVEENDIEVIQKYIDSIFHVDANVSFLMEKIHTKFSVSHNMDREYHHYFYSVDISPFLSIMNKEEFTYQGIFYKWCSMDYLMNDERIQEVNGDIVGFLKEAEGKGKSMFLS